MSKKNNLSTMLFQTILAEMKALKHPPRTIFGIKKEPPRKTVWLFAGVQKFTCC
jgi:hypothetical protein